MSFIFDKPLLTLAAKLPKSMWHRYSQFLSLWGGSVFDRSGGMYHFHGMEFDIPKDLTDRQFRGRFVLGGYESDEEYRFFKEYISSDDRVVELGGCLGVAACFINRLLAEPKNHVVFEANPKLIQYLESNRDRNGCKFSIENAVISSRDVESFFLHNKIVGGSLKRQTANEVEVTGVSVKTLHAKYGQPSVAVIDIEGGELALLREHPDFFSPLRIVFIEVHPFADILSMNEACECENCLQQLGFIKKVTDASMIYQVWARK